MAMRLRYRASDTGRAPVPVRFPAYATPSANGQGLALGHAPPGTIPFKYLNQTIEQLVTEINRPDAQRNQNNLLRRRG